jgi:hypothetical protein
MLAVPALLTSMTAGGTKRLHLQVLIGVVEHRGVRTDVPASHRAFQAAFITPGELWPEGLPGLLRGDVEPTALEAACSREVSKCVPRRPSSDSRFVYWSTRAVRNWCCSSRGCRERSHVLPGEATRPCNMPRARPACGGSICGRSASERASGTGCQPGRLIGCRIDTRRASMACSVSWPSDASECSSPSSETNSVAPRESMQVPAALPA